MLVRRRYEVLITSKGLVYPSATLSIRFAANEQELLSVALALGARRIPGWTDSEERLVADLAAVPQAVTRRVRNLIIAGTDPLGRAFSEFRSPEERRPAGATYTPSRIVRLMVRWAAALGDPARVVDPGVGSARFLIRAAKRFPSAQLVGIELDPVAAVLARAHLAAAGLGSRAQVILGDYRSAALAPIHGRTCYLGNPPYVRHHLISQEWKGWLAKKASERKIDSSQLAGLYVYFFLSTILKAKQGDTGVFITAAEWMDVNYGRMLRQMFLGDLGGKSIALLEPTAQPFPDAATTATITCFEIGAKPRTIRLKRAHDLSTLGKLDEGGRVIRRERLEAANRWTPLTRVQRKAPEGFIELGELCRVHRGQVTGSNEMWIAGPHSEALPESVLFPSVTKARELFASQGALRDAKPLRCVIDLPVDLDEFEGDERKSVDRFIAAAKKRGVDQGYIARTRRAWWAVGLREPAPILATYMARRPPAFVLNFVDARHINIAHGLYPREPLTSAAMKTLATFLSSSVSTNSGRTYAGGLTKFEPKEMERLLVPDLKSLTVGDFLPLT